MRAVFVLTGVLFSVCVGKGENDNVGCVCDVACNVRSVRFKREGYIFSVRGLMLEKVSPSLNRNWCFFPDRVPASTQRHTPSFHLF